MTTLLLISDREPLAWLLREQRFAMPANRASSAPTDGTQLLLYTTRGCYRNPGRDRGLVMGVATVAGDAEVLDEPVRFRDREYQVGFGLAIDGLAEPHDGVELAPLAGELDALPEPATWSVGMRRTLLPLSDRDARLILDKLEPKLRNRSDVLADYLRECKVTTTAVGGAG
jgi:hypothetical protein